jgi:glycosyltransferase involved in cell wall biosynthesis
MRILIPNTYYYLRGGDCTYAFGLTELLQSKGHEVIPFAMHHPNNFESPYSEYFAEYIDFAESLGKLSVKESVKVVARVIYSKEAKTKINRAIADFKPEITHVQNIHHHLTPSVLFALKKAGVPIVWTLHDYKLICPNSTFLSNNEVCEKCGRNKYYSAVATKCKKNSLPASLMSTIEAYAHYIMRIRNTVDMFVAPSDFLRNMFVSRGFNEDKIITIPNFISFPTQDFSGISEDYIVYSGRLSPDKGIETLLKAMTKCRDIRLLVAGDGPLRADLEQFVKDQKLNNVVFLGYVDSSRLKEIVSKAMFTVIPSRWYENCPYSILESFAFGKPVVGARIGGIPELIKDGESGYLFEPENVDELVAKIKTLTSNTDARAQMGKNALSKVDTVYNPDAYYEKIINVYQKVKPQ